MNKNKFFLLSCEGTVEVNRNGEHMKKFSSEVTGKANYDNRMEQGRNQDPSLVPQKPNSLMYVPKYYNPQPDKFDGYMQIPRPRGASQDKMQHITGSAKDFYRAKEEKSILVLQEKQGTGRRAFESDVVKVINGQGIRAPVISGNFRQYRAKNSRTKPQTFTSTEINTKNNTTNISPRQYSFEDLQLRQTFQKFSVQGGNNQLAQAQYKIKTLQSNIQTAVKPFFTLKLRKDLFSELGDGEEKSVAIIQKPTRKSRTQSNPQIDVNLYRQSRQQFMMLRPELFVVEKPSEKDEARKRLNKMKDRQMLEKLNMIQ